MDAMTTAVVIVHSTARIENGRVTATHSYMDACGTRPTAADYREATACRAVMERRLARFRDRCAKTEREEVRDGK